jgi:hypothetical protein
VARGTTVDTDYLVVGAGAMGMAFTDALVDHADVHVTVVDRRHAAGGHWLDAYPFVQLHQASVFYGAASTVLGTGALQTTGPETGLQQRARVSEIRAYYDQLLFGRLVGSGRVSFLGRSDYHADVHAGATRHVVTSLVSGDSVEVTVRRRVVDASYLAPAIPATTPPPFTVAAGADVVSIHELAAAARVASCYAIVGSGKTATDAILWLLGHGVSPDRVIWVRPRDPWMLDRATVQPDPVVALGLSADILEAAAAADSVDDLFLRLEAARVMCRIDRDVTPAMAKTPTLGRWELERLRTIENVVRLGHVAHVTERELVLERGSVALPRGARVVHCAASGLQYPPATPIWSPDRIRVQLVRAGFPCFNAALVGYVEATRDDDRERNRLCPPNIYPDTPASWAAITARGIAAARTFGAEPDIAAWANRCALNPSRLDASRAGEPAVVAARARLAAAEPGVARLAELGRESARDRP